MTDIDCKVSDLPLEAMLEQEDVCPRAAATLLSQATRLEERQGTVQTPRSSDLIELPVEQD